MNLSEHLKEISEMYKYLGDSSRYISFSKASLAVENLSLDSETTLTDIPNIGKSIEQVIKEYLQDQSSSRHKELSEKVPLSLYKELPYLYNFDKEYLDYLQTKFNCSSVESLHLISEERVQNALSKYSKDLTYFDVLPPNLFIKLILGDGLTQTMFSGSNLSIEELVKSMKSKDFKHIFVADNISSPNQLGITNINQFLLQKKKIQQLQLENNVRIWQGCVVDVSLDGTLLASNEILTSTDYIILTCSSSPHQDQIKRLSQRVKDKPTFYSLFDRFSSALDQTELQVFINTFEPTFIIKSPDDQASSSILNKLNACDLSKAKFLIGSHISNLNTIDLAFDLYMRLNLKSYKEHLRNLFANPFQDSHLISNSIGIKGEIVKKQVNFSNQNKLNKISEAIARFDLEQKKPKRRGGK